MPSTWRESHPWHCPPSFGVSIGLCSRLELLPPVLQHRLYWFHPPSSWSRTQKIRWWWMIKFIINKITQYSKLSNIIVSTIFFICIGFLLRIHHENRDGGKVKLISFEFTFLNLFWTLAHTKVLFYFKNGKLLRSPSRAGRLRTIGYSLLSLARKSCEA